MCKLWTPVGSLVQLRRLRFLMGLSEDKDPKGHGCYEHPMVSSMDKLIVEFVWELK